MKESSGPEAKRVARKKIKLLLADDHPLVREGIRVSFENCEHIVVLGEARNGHEAVAKARELQPDVVLMDISMPGLNGIEATKELTGGNSPIKVLILTVHGNREYVLELIRCGASGYLLKDSSPEVLVQAVEAIHSGESFFSPPASRVLLDSYQELSSGKEQSAPELSHREKQVLTLISQEYSTKEIAGRLGVNFSTAATYRQRLMRKLNIRTTAGLTKFAITHGIAESF